MQNKIGYLIIAFLSTASASTSLAMTEDTSKLVSRCAKTLTSLSEDPDLIFAQQLVVTKPRVEARLDYKGITEIINAVSETAKPNKSESRYRYEEDKADKTEKIVEKDVYSGKDTGKKIDLESLLLILKKSSPFANRIEISRDQQGHIYVLEIYSKNEFVIKNITTNTKYEFNPDQLIAVTKNVNVGTVNNQKLITLMHTDGFTLVIIAEGEQIFKLSFENAMTRSAL